MDVFSHGLYGGALSKIVSEKTGRSMSFRQSVWWGVFPDLFAFAIPMAWMFFQVLFGNVNFSELPRPGNSHLLQTSSTAAEVFGWSSTLYNYSHSLIIFALVFLGVWMFRRKPPLEMLAWVTHIFMDIPTHTAQFYPTPIFWPVSDIKFSGISWGTPWFMVLNYTVIITLYWVFRKRKKTKVLSVQESVSSD